MAFTLLVALATLIAGYLTISHAYAPQALAVSFGVIAITLAIRHAQMAIYGFLIYLPLVGFLRRLDTSATASDLLLLAGPLLLAALVTTVLGKRSDNRSTTPLRTIYLTFLAIATIESFNPLQGGFSVVGGGAVLYLLPMIWFVVGEHYLDSRMLTTVARIIATVGTIVALYGLSQSLIGFLPIDKTYAATKIAAGYNALYVGTTLRPFASFSSAAEYASYLAVAMTCTTAILLRAHGLKKAGPAAALLVITAALLLSSGRGAFILGIAGTAAVLAANLRARLITAVLVVGVSLVGIQAVATHYENTSTSANTQQLLSHQLQGIAAPTSSASDANTHVQLILDGIKASLSMPLGHGNGAVTRSLSGSTAGSFNAEADFGNVPYADGVLGLGLFVGLYIMGIGGALIAARRQDSSRLAMCAGVLIALTFQWLNGSQYATSPLAWLMLGAIHRQMTPTSMGDQQGLRSRRRPTVGRMAG